MLSDDEEVCEDKDIVPEHEDYFFPTPDEVREARSPAVGMLFGSLIEAQKFVNVYETSWILSYQGEQLPEKSAPAM